MKKLLIPFLAMSITIIISCNSDDKKHDHSPTADEPKTEADSLMKDIDEGHNAGMGKIGTLHNTQKNIQRIIDSIGKLPAKVQQAAAPYVDKLKASVKDLEYADFAMDKWMTEFEMDSAINNVKQRIQYLTEEKLKVDKVKEAMLTGLQKADSLLRSKF